METLSALLALCAGKSPVPVNSPKKGQWHGALMFSVICAWINDWVNNREAGDLRRHCGHYDVNVMIKKMTHSAARTVMVTRRPIFAVQGCVCHSPNFNYINIQIYQIQLHRCQSKTCLVWDQSISYTRHWSHTTACTRQSGLRRWNIIALIYHKHCNSLSVYTRANKIPLFVTVINFCVFAVSDSFNCVSFTISFELHNPVHPPWRIRQTFEHLRCSIQ